MEFNLIFSTDTLIALLALTLGIGSSIYTWHSNRYSIELFHPEKEIIRGNKMISFSIANTSSKPIRIKDVELLSNNLKITDNKFDPVKYDKDISEKNAVEYEEEHTTYLFGGISIPPTFNPYKMNLSSTAYLETSNNFTNEVFLLPSEEIAFSYFVDVIPTSVVVSTNKKIHCFKNKKSFFPHFEKFN